MNDRDARISAAGVVQAVIASGAPIEEWPTRAIHGLNVVRYAAKKLKGETASAPSVPVSLLKKENR